MSYILLSSAHVAPVYPEIQLHSVADLHSVDPTVLAVIQPVHPKIYYK